jgi:transcriptional regulator with XRE-family HTH domain
MDSEILRRKIQNLVGAQDRGVTELSLAIGKSRSYLSGYLNRTGVEDPSIGTMSRLAKELGVSLSYFDDDTLDFENTAPSDIDRQASKMLTEVLRSARTKLLAQGDRPSMDTVVGWWQETNGRLENCDALMPYVDLVSASGLDHGAPQVKHMGARGLSAKTLNSKDTCRLQSFINTLNEVDMEALKKNIATVRQVGIGMVTPQTRLVPATETAEAVQVDFVRLMLPVKDAVGMPYVLNFSTLLSVSSPKNSSGLVT